MMKMPKRLLNYLLVFLACIISNVNSQADGADPTDENYDICELPYLGGDKPKPVPDGVMRMGRNSKYFILAGEPNVPIQIIADFCKTIGLQPAEVRHHIELIALQIFLKENSLLKVVFSLGMNDKLEAGNFKEFDGTPVKFHSFAEGRPNNKLHNCVAVSFDQKHQHLVYNNVDCNQGVTPVCMFKPTDRCYLGSPLTFARINEEFQFAGSSTARDYFVQLKQYPWSEASSVCEKAGFHLVDFNTGLNNNQMLYDLIKKWLKRNYIFPGIPFWTGAKIVPIDSVSPSSGSPQYKFERSGKVLNDLSEWPSLVWDSEEPSDSSGLGLEKCISAILFDSYQSNGDRIFSLATTNCLIPQYPICYQDKSLQTFAINETAGETKEVTDILETRSSSDGRKAGKVCNEDELKLNISEEVLSDDDLLTLITLGRLMPIDGDEFRFKWKFEKTWLTSVVEEIYRVPRQVCPNIYVPKEYLNVMQNLLILYYNAVADQLKDPDEPTQQNLEKYASSFSSCKEKVEPIHFETAGGLPITFEKFNVTPIQELVETEREDGEPLVADFVIDTFWYMYVITVGACYPYQNGTKILWLQEIHNLFTTYYLEVFQERWFTTKASADWGVIVGDLDIHAAYYSLAACAIAAFHRNNISDLYFPRALILKTRHNDEELNLKMQELPEFVVNNEN